MTTEIGPVQYLVIGFPGNKFNGEIAPELGKLASSGVVRILDIVFVGKDTDGSVVVFEYDELEELALFAEIDGEVGGLANSDDVSTPPACSSRGARAPSSCGRTPGPPDWPRPSGRRVGRSSKVAASRHDLVTPVVRASLGQLTNKDRSFP